MVGRHRRNCVQHAVSDEEEANSMNNAPENNVTMLFRKAIPRRTFLRGAGAPLALPLLDSMMPALARAAEKPAAQRLGFVYVPNGVIMDAWTPKAEGANFELPTTLKPLAPFRDQLQV